MKQVLRLPASTLLLFAAATIAVGLLRAQQPAVADLLDEAAAKADALWRSGRYSEAAEVMKPAVQAAEKAGPSNGRRLAIALTILGMIYHNQWRLTEAERLLRRAMGIWESKPASDAKWRLRTVVILASVYSTTGRFALSEKLLRAGLYPSGSAIRLLGKCSGIARVGKCPGGPASAGSGTRHNPSSRTGPGRRSRSGGRRSGGSCGWTCSP